MSLCLAFKVLKCVINQKKKGEKVLNIEYMDFKEFLLNCFEAKTFSQF